MDDGIHLRFFFTPRTLGHVLLPYIIDRGQSYGTPTIFSQNDLEPTDVKHKKIVVEFSSPNLGKEFDGLHLRSTIIGAYLASIYESMGWEVTRMNFLGDWGQPIGLLAAGWSRFGSEDALNEDPLRHLLDVYTQIDELAKDEQANSQELPADGQLSGIAAERDANFTALENGEPNAYALWKRFREVSIQRYTDLYARMNIRFDDYSGESEVNHETIAEVELSLQDKIVFDETRDGWTIDFSTHETKLLKTGHAKIRNGRGQTTYLLRDIASALDRSRKYGFDKLLYVVSARQDSHFQQLFAVLELMGHSELADRLQHISFNAAVKGLVPQDGAKGLLLSDILNKCQATIFCLSADDPDRYSHFQDPLNLEFCDSLGVIALMTQDLSIKRKDDLIFDIANIGNSEETGVDLQSCVTRLNRKLDGVVIDREDLENADYSLFDDETYAEILRVLIQFPTVIKSSLEKLESSLIAAYLFRLVGQVEDILGDAGESEASGSTNNLAQLALHQIVRQVLMSGMRIIGLTPIEEPFLQEHSGIVPLEAPAEAIVEGDATAASLNDTQPSHDSDPVPVADASNGPLKESADDEGIVEPAANPGEFTEGFSIDATATKATEECKEITTPDQVDNVPVESASDTIPATVYNLDPVPEENVAVKSEDNQADKAHTVSLPEAVENLKIEDDDVPATEAQTTDASIDEAPAVQAVSAGDINSNDAHEPETLEGLAHNTANPAEDVKHEASGSSDFEHYKSTTLNEEHHITMPDHVATVEAH